MRLRKKSHIEWKPTKHPFLLELNAWIALKRLSKKHGKALALSSIPVKELQIFSQQGFDLIWLMGVWKRSPGARERAVTHTDLQKHLKQILPDCSDKDIAGSPYAVFDYTPDPYFGKREDLIQLKGQLHKAGLGLIVDYVPNHLAFDHPRTLSKPECFVRVSEEEASQNPELFFKTSQGLYLAHGKDPYFPPWTDTVQINFFSSEAREAAVQELLRIAEMADGVRCDMAMLGLNSVFENVWGRFIKNKRPQKEFWEEIVGRVKAKYPKFIFMAEVYWDMEWQLQQLGFDYTYDKKLYDQLRFSPPEDIFGHLRAEHSYLEKSVHFIENHDERRAVEALGREKSYAAAAIIATIPGIRFFHEGQLEGKKIHQTIQLGREIEEEGEDKTKEFYKRLLKFAADELLHSGIWQLINAAPELEDQSYRNLLSWSWQKENAAKLTIINYSSSQARGRIQIPKEWLTGKLPLKFRDQYSGEIYERDPKELRPRGLGVALGPWKMHLFELNISHSR